MKQALLVIGVPETKILRKRVVSKVVPRDSWFGVAVQKKLIKAFREVPDGDVWINEGVCGVQTDDAGWRYYDVAAIDSNGNAANYIGPDAGWLIPDDPSDNNLWYEPPPGMHGRIMHETVKDLYGRWSPADAPPYELGDIYFEKQVKVSVPPASGSSLFVDYRTEGAKDYGQKVKIELLKLQGAAYQSVAVVIKLIESEWNNSGNHTFGGLSPGDYKVRVSIQTSDGQTPFRVSWQAESARRTIAP